MKDTGRLSLAGPFAGAVLSFSMFAVGLLLSSNPDAARDMVQFPQHDVPRVIASCFHYQGSLLLVFIIRFVHIVVIYVSLAKGFMIIRYILILKFLRSTSQQAKSRRDTWLLLMLWSDMSYRSSQKLRKYPTVLLETGEIHSKFQETDLSNMTIDLV